MSEDKDNKCLLLEKRPEGLNPRQIRKNHKIPVTVYSKRLPQSLSLQIDTKEFSRIRNSRFVRKVSGILEDGNNKEEHILIIKSIEKHPLTDEILNVQFHKVDVKDEVIVNIPIVYTGVSPLTQIGGNLFVNKKTVEIKSLAGVLPTHIEFDLSKLTADKNLAYYSDLDLPEGVVLDSDETQIIVKCSVPTIE